MRNSGELTGLYEFQIWVHIRIPGGLFKTQKAGLHPPRFWASSSGLTPENLHLEEWFPDDADDADPGTILGEILIYKKKKTNQL